MVPAILIALIDFALIKLFGLQAGLIFLAIVIGLCILVAL